MKNPETKICPRCKINLLRDKPDWNATSRRDNKTLICPNCALSEAMVDANLAPEAEFKVDRFFIQQLLQQYLKALNPKIKKGG